MDLKQVWFAGVHADIGGSYGRDRKTGTSVSDIALGWMLREASSAGLKFDPHISSGMTSGVSAPLHRSRKHIFRLKKAVERDLTPEDIPTKIHPSVRSRWNADPKYRPAQLEQLVKDVGWGGINVGE